MDIPEDKIRTGVDALIKLLYEKKKISIEEASSLLGIPKERLEDWGRVLEEEGIIRLEYSFTKTYLVWTAGVPGGAGGGAGKTGGQAFSGMGVEQGRDYGGTSGAFGPAGRGAYPNRGGGFGTGAEEESSEFQQEVVSDEAELSRLLARVQIKGEQIRDLEKTYLELYKGIDPSLLDSEKRLQRLKELEAKREEIYSKHSSQLDSIKKSAEALAKSLEESSKSLEAVHAGYESAGRDIDSAEAKISEYQKIARKLFDVHSTFEKSALGIASKIKREESALKTPGEAEELLSRLKKSSAEFEAIRKQLSDHLELLSRVRMEVTSDKRLAANLQSLFESSDKKAKKLRGDLAEIERKSGEFGSSAKDVLSEVRAQKAELEAVLSSESLLRQILSDQSSFERMKADTEKHMEELSRGRDELEKRISSLKASLDSLPSQMERKKKIEEALSELSSYKSELEGSLARGRQLSAELSGMSARQKARELESMKKALSSSIQKQSASLEKLKTEYLKVYDGLSGSLGGIDSEIRAQREEINSQLKKADFVIGKMKEFEGRKGDVKKILDSVTALRADQEKLEKKVAELAGRMKDSKTSTPQITREEFEMSQRDYERFEQKREKLKGMIEALWKGKPN